MESGALCMIAFLNRGSVQVEIIAATECGRGPERREEAAAAGITDILIITNRGKGVIEDHFDYSFELEQNLFGKAGKEQIYEDVRRCAELANIYFIRQKETKGLGHAVLQAESFVRFHNEWSELSTGQNHQ